MDDGRSTTRTRLLSSAILYPLSSILALAPALGCQVVPKNEPVALHDEPLIIDEAMQLRDWDRSSSTYADTAVVAGPHGRVLEPKPDAPAYQQVLADTPLTLANFVMLPVTLVITPPWKAIGYRGAITPPTYTAVPPLPPAPPAQPRPLLVPTGETTTQPPGTPGTPDEPTPAIDVPMPTQPATMQDAPDRPTPVPPNDPSVTPGDPPAAEPQQPDAGARENEAAPPAATQEEMNK